MNEIRQTRRKFKSTFAVILVLVMILVGVIGFGFVWYDSSTKNPAGSDATEVNFTVNAGESFLSLLPRLEEQKLIKSALATKIYLKVNGINPAVKPGEYQIPQNLTLTEIIDRLEQGVFKESVWVTIKEGKTYIQIGEELSSELKTSAPSSLFSYNDFIQIVENPDAVEFSPNVETFLSFVKPQGKSLQGIIYPDTYRFDTDMDAKAIIEVMILNLETRFNENAIDYKNFSGNKGVNNMYEAIILGSILEKEANNNDNKNIVSGIFHNRLVINHPLQSDATVNFFTGKNDAGILFVDRDTPSPYNTYLNPGLTPEPINSPSVGSIKAAMEPEATDYFYFYHDSTGNPHYSVTYQQHLNSISNFP